MSTAEYSREYRAKNRERMLVYYQKHKVKIRAQQNRFRLERNAFVNEQKSRPCMDCEQTFHHSAMDFDHRPGEVKVDKVSTVANGRTLKHVMAEISKCDLVCANCHRVRTYLRGQTKCKSV